MNAPTRTPLQEIIWLRACLAAALEELRKTGEREIRLPLVRASTERRQGA